QNSSTSNALKSAHDILLQLHDLLLELEY
ncbi:hypothetical protein Tco_0640822, partial [Tanacetum coccineum]